MFCFAHVGNVEMTNNGINHEQEKRQNEQRSTESARRPCDKGNHSSNESSQFARNKNSVAHLP